MRSKKKKKEDIGLGNNLNGDSRFINKDGSFNVRRTGARVKTPYQDLIEMSTLRFFSIIIGGFILINVVFAFLFLLSGAGTLNGVDGSQSLFIQFLYAFFFSVQTFTTVGYGTISPGSLLGNIFAALDALIGLLSLAIASGLFFARFSKPKAYIIYSRNMIVAPYRGQTALMFRVANIRDNKIIDLKVEVTVAYIEMEDGVDKRKYALLPLEIERIGLFALSWTVVHPIDKDSLFRGKTKADFERMKVEFIIQFEGHDETYAQTIHAHYSYLGHEVKWGYRFLPMYERGAHHTILHLGDIDKMEPAKI